MAAQDNAFEPVRFPEAAEGNTEIEMVPLFYLGDTAYEIPKYPDTRIALRYLRNARDKGEIVAAGDLMVELVGEDGFNALCDYPGLRQEQFEEVMTLAQEHVVGALEKSRGNSGRGSRK